NGTISFLGNDTEVQTITVTILNDNIIEPSEAYTVVLNSTTNPLVPINDATANGIINDDDSDPSLGVQFDLTSIDVNEDAGTVNLTVSLNAIVQDTFTVEFYTANGTAETPNDYTGVLPSTQTITFGGTNNNIQTIIIPIIDDIIIENTENFQVILTNISTSTVYVLANDTANVNIIDNDGNEGYPTDITIEACDVIPPAVTITSTSSCAINTVLVETIDGDMDNCPSEYTITRTWTITDCVGNVRTHTQIITIEDTITPTFVEALPQNMTVACAEIPDAETLTANDNCDANATVVFTETATNNRNCSAGYVITRTWTAADCAGNETFHTQTVTILPSGPITVVPYDEEMTITCGDDIPEVPTLEFMGGCGNYDVQFTEVEEFSSTTEDYMIIRTWVVTDSCDNTASFEQTIFVMQPEKEFITIDICIEDPEIDLLSYLPANFDTNGTFEITSGNGSLNGSYLNPIDFEIGEYLISYTSTDTSCKFFADFTINVNNDCTPCNIKDVNVSKTVTVNGDGINDFFEITGVENCGFEFHVMLFNRWGDKVYESMKYDNDWGGFAPSGSFGNSGVLPSGTYYYIISISNRDNIKPLNGYIYLGTQQ
ncbi:gliding motility-associated C-terminal domain-containing protein, partial [Maribacter sp.]|uniref:T9SS type B sorting domain-containing protein n=1 Tax=Maribacter sp. TaxID=1897614 RepID=UPI0025C6A7DD